MPQMYPILWMPLFMYFSLVFIIFIILTFYTNMKSMKKNKVNNIYFNKNFNNWMW